MNRSRIIQHFITRLFAVCALGVTAPGLYALAAPDVAHAAPSRSSSSKAGALLKPSPAKPVPAKPAPADAPAEPANPGSMKDALGLKGNGDDKAPVFIKSDTLSLDSKGRVFTYRGNVEVVRDDLVITSDVMVGRYDDQSKIQTLVCQDNVVITRADRVRATANRAIYRVPEATIELTEGPEIIQNGNALSADRIVMFVDEDRSEAEGNVQVKVIKSESSAGTTAKKR